MNLDIFIRLHPDLVQEKWLLLKLHPNRTTNHTTPKPKLTPAIKQLDSPPRLTHSYPLTHPHSLHFLLQCQPLRPTKFHQLVINIRGKRGASGSNYSITYGCKCTLRLHENTHTHTHLYITMSNSSPLLRSGYPHQFNTIQENVMSAVWLTEKLGFIV